MPTGCSCLGAALEVMPSTCGAHARPASSLSVRSEVEVFAGVRVPLRTVGLRPVGRSSSEAASRPVRRLVNDVHVGDLDASTMAAGGPVVAGEVLVVAGVIDCLVGHQRSAEMALHDQAVQGEHLPVDADLDVAVGTPPTGRQQASVSGALSLGERSGEHGVNGLASLVRWSAPHAVRGARVHRATTGGAGFLRRGHSPMVQVEV